FDLGLAALPGFRKCIADHAVRLTGMGPRNSRAVFVDLGDATLVVVMSMGLGGGNKTCSHPDADGAQRQSGNEPAFIGQAARGDHWNADLIDHARNEHHRADTPDMAAALMSRRN